MHKDSVFILGMFNSGSTWLAQLVNCHIPRCPGSVKGYENQQVESGAQQATKASS
jgi:hypothetical protein